MSLSQISVTILTKNSEKYLNEVLKALSNFNEVAIYDTGSTDNTLIIARQFPNVVIHQGRFQGFGPTHNLASKAASNDWILSIDSDEVVTQEMENDIANVALNEKCVYSFPRDNYFNGTWIRWCGWYPDHQIRLYNRKETRFTDAQVHEAIIAEGMQKIEMTGPIRHYSYETIADFLTKMQSYSTLFAEQNCGKKKSSPWKAILHCFFAFFKSYILKNGFLGGYEGFLISSYNAHTAFYKYLKLYEANNSKAAKFEEL